MRPSAAYKLWTIAASGVALLALGYGALRVMQLERAELAFEGTKTSLRALQGKPGATRIGVRVGEVKLRAGQFSVFELCAADGLPEASWQGALEFAVLHLEAKQLMLRVPFDAAHLQHVQRNHEGGCLRLGSGAIQHAGTYTVEAIWPQTPPPAAVLDVPIALRVLAKSPLTARDRSCVLVLGLAVLCLIAAALAATRNRANATQNVASQARGVHAVLTLVALALLYGLSQLPSPGSTFALAKGVLLLALQTGLAWWFTRQFAQGHVAHALGLWAPLRMGVALSSALIAWPLLVGTARLALRWVPSTGEAPIQSFISWPSGMLAAALLGVLLPAAEELFFRGYLFAALLPFGRAAAAVGSVALFGLMHAEQSWGNWGGLAAVFAAGAVLCSVRVLTDSTLIAALTHVAYNLTLSLASIAAAAQAP